MASPLRTKLRIAASVLFGFGFWDAVAGRFVWHPDRNTGTVVSGNPPAPDFTALRGALHVHTTYSDGAGDVPTVMEAAREADVDFLLLCDHNTQLPRRDGWEARYPTRPYLLIGTEVTVKKGAFLLALDMPDDYEPVKARPPQEAIDRINQDRGLPLISLPFDVKHPWVEWDVTGCEGLEVLNLSTIARRHINFLSLPWLLLVGGLTKLAGKEPMPAALRALITRPDAAIARWDRLTASGRQSVGIGALDAHALMKIGKKKYPIPSYVDSLRVVTTHVLVSPDCVNDREKVKAEIYQAMRRGRCYFSYDCFGDPRPFKFWAVATDTNNGRTEIVPMGERITRDTGGSIRLTASAAPDTLLRLYRRGQLIATGVGSLTYTASEAGAYRVEGYKPGIAVGPLHLGARPWIFSNPIYVD